MNRFELKPVMAVLCLLYTMLCQTPVPASAALQCFDCHGTKNDHDLRPVDSSFRNPSGGGFQGNHRTHVSAGAAQPTCAKCHPGSNSYQSAHRDGAIKLASNINVSPHPDKAIYKGTTSAWVQVSNPVTGTCSNVNCHFESESPLWGGAALVPPSQCNVCHGAPPSDGSHPASSGSGKKHGDYYGLTTSSCNNCHTDHLSEGNSFAHVTSAGKRPLTVRFTRFPYSGAYYNGSTSYPKYLPSQHPSRNGACANYCHSNAANGPANLAPLTWSGTKQTQCYSCHKGRSSRPDTIPVQATDNTEANCLAIQGHWSSSGIKQYCTPDLVMRSNGHHRLVGGQWIRKYPCWYCHSKTVAPNGTLTNLSSMTKHVNGKVDVVMSPIWAIANRPDQSYDAASKTCSNTYCHSDGTTDPDDVRPFAWTETRTDCNSCHGHRTGTCSNSGCHDGTVHAGDPTQKLWTLPAQYGNAGSYHWPIGQEWLGSLPMFPNLGPLSNRPNSHRRHAQVDFTCDNCHAKTVASGICSDCHKNGIPTGGMGEAAHVNAEFHVNRIKDVDFKNPEASYNKNTRACSNTICHVSGTNPVWGNEVNSVTCLSCHGITGSDTDDFNAFNGVQGKINLTEWASFGHGRYSSAINPQTGAPYGSYPKSLNPAANFPGNPCWYCHDDNVVHKDAGNPFRLKMHTQYQQRFLKECLYCHMERTNAECFSCHVGQTESLSPQATPAGIRYRYKFNNLSTKIDHADHTYVTNCIDGGGSCHTSDSNTHKTNAGVWTSDMKKDVLNQYRMMGVCLQCHDDDSSGQCTSCHVAPADNPNKYSLGYDPGTGYIKPKKARASGGHFGYKHYRDFTNSGGWLKHYTSVKSPIYGTYSVVNGTWKGGKFCWDCHDPHGDNNIYMIQSQVATTTDGIFGVPRTFSSVVLTDIKGANYAVKSAQGAVFNGICNVCHSPSSKHFTSDSGDSHNINRRCTICHQHRFSDSHADNQACNGCHKSSKPIPKHSAFGLPRDCTKCHSGTIGNRMDIMGQLNSNSHHIQGVTANNKHCYACHWEATPEGLIDTNYHTGYNYLNYSSVKNDVVDLVLYGPGTRPATYRLVSSAAGRATAIQYRASNIGTGQERSDVAKITNHCLSCHSDQNNNTDPFGDCKNPRQYAWDQQSIAARYSQTGAVTWGKYAGTANAAKKNITKAFSAHGKATLSGGGFKNNSGLDGAIPNTRAGSENVQCFDCHNSHGSKVTGTTSSYATFNGSKNGANLKETQQLIGGYTYKYQASSNTSGVNPYSEGAGQCFDCHNSATAGTTVPSGKTPWGYNSTFGAAAPVMGYKDTPRFGTPATDADIKASTKRFAERYSRKNILGGHLQASVPTGSLPHLAKDSGNATGGSANTLTDSTKNWTGTAYSYASATITTSGTLYNPWLQANQNTRKPAGGYWSPPGGGTFSRIHVKFIGRNGNYENSNYDHFKVYNASNTLLVDLTNSYDGWIDITPTTGIYTVYTTYYQYGPYSGGGDLPEVIVKGTATPTNIWANFYLLMTGGSNSGQPSKITSNTATTLTFEPFNAPVLAGDSYKIVPYSATINGLCTPCHDPHGVSPTLGSNQAYALPLLKGTWMTSPYKEDAPPPVPTGQHIFNQGNNGNRKAWGRYSTSNHAKNAPLPTQPVTRHTLDRNTFGSSTRISENDDRFAGLCLNCHNKATLTDGVNRNNFQDGFKTVDRIHESVKGWGVNSEHSFTCSKCHQPHNSGLPRLMQTNCLDYKHRGNVAGGSAATNGEPWAADKQYGSAHGQGQEHRGYPIGSMFGNQYATAEAYTACHVARYGRVYNNGAAPADWPNGNMWNNITPW